MQKYRQYYRLNAWVWIVFGSFISPFMSFKLVNLLFSIYNGKTYNKVTARPYKLYLDMVEVIFLRFLVAAFYTTKVRHNVPIPQSIRAFQFRFQFQFQNRIWIRKYKKSNRKSKSSRILARLRYAMQMRLNYYAGPSTLSSKLGARRNARSKWQVPNWNRFDRHFKYGVYT